MHRPSLPRTISSASTSYLMIRACVIMLERFDKAGRGGTRREGRVRERNGERRQAGSGNGRMTGPHAFAAAMPVVPHEVAVAAHGAAADARLIGHVEEEDVALGRAVKLANVGDVEPCLELVHADGDGQEVRAGFGPGSGRVRAGLGPD